MSDEEFDALLASIGTQQAAPITLPTPKPQPTGLVKGALKSLGRGVGGAISQVGKALEYDQNQQPDLVNKAGYYIDEFGNKVSNLIEAPIAEQGSQREKFFQAMESVPSSLAMALPAFAGGALGGPVGAVAGGALSYPIMQQATAQDTYERLSKERPELSEEKKRELAAQTGIWEAGPEAATNIAESLLFRTTPLGRGALPFIKAFGKNIAKSAPLEMAGEATTGYGQASTLKEVFPEVDPLQEAISGANVAAYMAPFMAGGGTILQKMAQPKETQPSTIPVEDNQTETDLLNKPYQVPADASLGTQQELFNNLKYTQSPFKEGPLTSVVEQGEVVIKDDRAGRKQLKALQQEAKAAGVTLDIKRVPAFGGGMAIRITPIVPEQGYVGVQGQPSLFEDIEAPNFVLQGGSPVEAAERPLQLAEEERVIENLPATKGTSALIPKVLEGELIPPTRINSRIGLTPEIEEATLVNKPVVKDKVQAVSLLPEPTPQLPTTTPKVNPILAKILEKKQQQLIAPPVGDIHPVVKVVESKINSLTESIRRGQHTPQSAFNELYATPEYKQLSLEPVESNGIRYGVDGDAEDIIFRAFEDVAQKPVEQPLPIQGPSQGAASTSVDVQENEIKREASPRQLEDLTEAEIAAMPSVNYTPTINKTLKKLIGKQKVNKDVLEEFQNGRSLKKVGEDVIAPTPLQERQKEIKINTLKNKLEALAISFKSPKKKEQEATQLRKELYDLTGDVEYAPKEATSETSLETKLTELENKAKTSAGIDLSRIEDEIEEIKEKLGRAKDVSETTSQDTFTQQKNQVFLDFLELNANNPIVILDWIANNSNRKLHKEVANYLKSKIDKNLQVVPDNDIEAYAFYNPKFGMELPFVQYNFDLHQKKNEDLASTILHEFIHNAVDSKLATVQGKVYKNRLTQLKKQIRQELINAGKDPDVHYGLRKGVSVEELLTEAFSNKDLIKVLESIQLKEPEGPVKTLFDKFVDFVRSVLNIPVKDFSALKEVLSVGVATIEQTPSTTELGQPKAKGISYKEEFDYAKAKWDAAETAGERVLSSLGTLQGMFPEAHKVIREYLRNPFWVATKIKQTISESLGNALMKVVKESENKTATYNVVGRKLTSSLDNTKGLDTISAEYEKLSPEDQASVERLMVFGDFSKKEFDSVQDVPKNDYVGKVSDTAFKAYKDLRRFVNKILKQYNEEMINTALVKYNKKLRKGLENLILEKGEVTADKVQSEIKALLESDKEVNKDLVQDVLNTVLTTKQALTSMRTEIQGVPGYMARVRKPGQYKLNVYTEQEGKDGKPKKVRVYSGMFTSPFERDSFKDAFMKNPKEALGPNYKAGEAFSFENEYLPKGVVSKDTLGVMASDLTISDILDKIESRGKLDAKELGEMEKALSQASLEVLLGGTASGFKIKRLEDYISGFETNPIIALQTLVNNMARSTAKSRYMAAQMNNLKDIKDVNKEIYEYAFSYVRSTTQLQTDLDKFSSKARYAATTYFLAANVSASLINLMQNFIVGNSTLAKHTSFANANKLLAKHMKTLIPQNIKHSVKDSEQAHVANPPANLESQLTRALMQYRESGLNFDTQSALAAGINEDLSGGVIWKNFKTVMDKLMIPFKTVEVANREAALLASFEVFAKNEGVDLKKEIDQAVFDKLYDKSIDFVNQVHFMGQGNLPVGIQKSSILRAALALQSFGINFWNMLYTNSTSKDNRDRMVAVRILGMLFATGGFVGAFPAADDINKLLKKLLGYDPKLEAKNALGKMTSEDFAEFLVYGAPTLLGVNIANNVNIRIPVLSNLLGASDLGVASSGAVGSILARQWKALNYASDGDFVKALGIATPEGFARMFRAYDENTRGFTTAKGAPVYFEGKPLKLSETEALVKGVIGLRSSKEASIAEARFGKFELQQQWQNKRSVAVNKFARGDRQAMLDFNDALRDNDQARMLVKPITGADRLKTLAKKQPKRETAFEKEYS
jgi:hypothetical protein